MTTTCSTIGRAGGSAAQIFTDTRAAPDLLLEPPSCPRCTINQLFGLSRPGHTTNGLDRERQHDSNRDEHRSEHENRPGERRNRDAIHYAEQQRLTKSVSDRSMSYHHDTVQ